MLLPIVQLQDRLLRRQLRNAMRGGHRVSPETGQRVVRSQGEELCPRELLSQLWHVPLQQGQCFFFLPSFFLSFTLVFPRCIVRVIANKKLIRKWVDQNS